MNTINKLLIAGLLSCSLLTVAAQPGHEGVDAQSGATPTHEAPMPGPDGHHGCPAMGPACQPVEFQSVKICYAPMRDMFVAIDSVECSVHLVKMEEESLDTVASYQTDNIHKRHDLKNILRPVSVGFMGPYVVVLASAVNDTAYVGLFDESLKPVARRSFKSPMYAMHMEPGRLFVVGRNPYGYDINIIPVEDPEDLEGFEKGEMLSHHYRVAKQAEKIKNSDPIGIGLTAVAVAVVFLALVCISLILQGSGKLMSGMDDKKKKDKKKGGAAVQASAAAADKEGEIYAAIATAIHLYNDELHDEEDAVITIQKVEREWTPWNAKYYNMNQYFNKVRR